MSGYNGWDNQGWDSQNAYDSVNNPFTLQEDNDDGFDSFISSSSNRDKQVDNDLNSDQNPFVDASTQYRPYRDNDTSDTRDFIEYEQQQQEQIMREQDDQLDQVVVTLGSLKGIASLVNQELDEQGELLNDLDLGVDGMNSKIKKGVKNLQEFIQENADTKQQWTICCLIFILLILLVIIILT